MDRPDPRQLNAQMVRKLLAEPPAPLADGGYALRVLETVGRRTAAARQTPVGVLAHDGAEYAICPDRGRDWARNLLAEPECLLRAGNEIDRRTAVPVDGDLAADAVHAYLSVVRVPWARSAFGLPEDPTHQDVLAALPRYAVFRLAAA